MLPGNNETYATGVNDIIIKRIELTFFCVPGTQTERISDTINKPAYKLSCQIDD